MPSYMQLKSPFRSPSMKLDLAQGLDRKAEFIDSDGILRRSNSVTRRMIQRGASIVGAGDLQPEDQLHSSFETRKSEATETRRASMQLGEETARKCAANAVLKYRVKLNKEQKLEDVNQKIAQRQRRCEEVQQTLQELGDHVDVTEMCTALSPSKTNTYIDEEGNLRRRITSPPAELKEAQDGFVPGPATPPPPALSKDAEPRTYC
ncbi:hypothetical protein PHYPSEUDO_014887 [Phytophthora pseudosyringae]|uniref:Uncharacterized protein n=1 Tax=Phytophthora pseudosyringae TaxID=221518 RepID=A0A8T1W0Y6_9STRA|nr:hypothetical protein PHYPSEUDO_014887 [Phytophthora pseudosyringae]